MTDAELIAWLRGPYGDAVMDKAADRIEALVRELARTKTERDAEADAVTDLIHDLERVKDSETEQLNRAERLEAAASAVAEDVCCYICPSIGLAGRPIPHDPRCIALRTALKQKDRTDD